MTVSKTRLAGIVLTITLAYTLFRYRTADPEDVSGYVE